MENDVRGRLAELTPAECWELLATTGVGRIAWCTTEGPVVQPVNIAVDGTTLRVRTTPYSPLVQKVDAERVAIEVDRVDEETRTGWSVLARGRAEVRYGVVGGAVPEPWASGSRHTTVVVEVDQVTGRRLVPED